MNLPTKVSEVIVQYDGIILDFIAKNSDNEIVFYHYTGDFTGPDSYFFGITSLESLKNLMNGSLNYYDFLFTLTDTWTSMIWFEFDKKWEPTKMHYTNRRAHTLSHEDDFLPTKECNFSVFGPLKVLA